MPMTWVTAFCLSRYLDAPFSIMHAAALQGMFAGLITRYTHLERWWIVIQIGFPIAIVLTSALQLPPSLFLAIFLFMLVLYWSTFRTQVPFYPSKSTVWKALLPLLPAQRPIQMVDIGSGLGGLVLHLARSRPDSSFYGIELAPLPWLISRLRAAFTGSGARFTIGDYAALDLGQFDVVFAYLSPAAMPALWDKCRDEMQPGSFLFSYEFTIPGLTPQIIVLPDPQGPTLYGWQC